MATAGVAQAGDGPNAVLESRLDAWEPLLVAPSDEAFLSAWATVLADVRAFSSSAVCDVVESPEGRRFEARLAPFQRRYLLLAERAEAERLLRTEPGRDGGFRGLLGSEFGRSTFDRLEEAMLLADLDACRRVVVVGCGPLPAAALFFHERTRLADVTALELDPKAANLARAVCERHGSQRLTIVCQDGCDHDYGKADLVYVVNQVTPKPAVLRRIAETAPPNVWVLLRDPIGVGRLLAESVDGSLPEPWRVLATGTADPSFFSRHLVMARATSGSTDG